MSLNIIERRNTRREFVQNIQLIGQTTATIAAELGISEQQLVEIISLKGRKIEDPWIVRNYLIDYAQQNNMRLIPFSKLKGEASEYFFLDSKYIQNGQSNS